MNAPISKSRAPRISMVVPVRNAAATLERALTSLFDQDTDGLEVIVVDGASDDGTPQVIDRFRDRIDVLIQEPDAGQADALNKGFAAASGEIFGWLCADDALEPGALSTLAAALDAAPDAGLVTGGCRRIFADGTVIETRPAADFERRLDYVNTIEQPSTLWRAAAHRAAGDLDTGLKYAFDWDWWARLKRTGIRFTGIETIVSHYYFSADNLTSTGGDALADEMFTVIKRYGPHGGRLADAYRFLYRTFDKHGYYDRDGAAAPPEWRRRVFHLTLRALHLVYGRELIDSYNWNFASRQARGLDW